MMKLKQVHVLLLFAMSGVLKVGAQEKYLYHEVTAYKESGIEFTANTTALNRSTRSVEELSRSFNHFEEVFFLSYNNEILNSKGRFASMSVPTPEGDLELELIDVSESMRTYEVETSDGKTFSPNKENRFFRGVVKGVSHSMVALSFFKNEVSGVISTRSGQYNVVKLKDHDMHLVYDERNLTERPDFECGFESNSSEEYDPEVLARTRQVRTNGNCVRLYFETEVDIFQALGSVTNVENYVTAQFNMVNVLFQNESIKTRISKIKVWTTNDPYNAFTSFGLLQEFWAQTSSFNGDLGQLLTFRNGEGGRAATAGLCNSNVDARLSVCQRLDASVIPFPTYSFNVYLMTHEFGHSMGSEHTHSCVWNGNNTAIDGCAGGTSGACPLAPLPVGKGTIMSYCEQLPSVGIDFNLGFGPQPGNRIRDWVNSVTCLSSCTSCPVALNISSNVGSGGVDHQEADLSITANNNVSANGEALYHAGITVVLTDGFTSENGSFFGAYIEGCTGGFNKTEESAPTTVEFIEEAHQHIGFDVKIYPSITSDMFNVQLMDVASSNALKLRLVSITGAELHTQQIVQNTNAPIEVDIAHLPAGVYIVEVSNSGTGEKHSNRVVKK